MKQNLPGLSPLWLISLALVLGTTIVALIPFSISGGETIKGNDWIGFAGNVVGGAITLLAAVMAWFAVQRQIDNETSVRIAAQSDAKVAASAILRYSVFAAAVVSAANSDCVTAIKVRHRPDGGLEANVPWDLDDVFNRLRDRFPQLEFALSYPPIMEAWKDLSVTDKPQYLSIISTLQTIINLYRNPGPNFDRTTAAEARRKMFVGLEEELRKFDSALADLFVGDANL